MDPEENRKSGSKGLHGMEEGLYSRNTIDKEDRKITPIFKEGRFSVATDWSNLDNDKNVKIEKPLTKKKSNHSFIKILLTFSVLFFLIAVSYASFKLFFKSNYISSENVFVEVSGPVSVGAGEQFSFDVSVRNGNNVPLEGVVLSVEYPNGTREVLDTSKELKRKYEDIGIIEPDQFVTNKFEAVIYGEENNQKVVKISVDYRVKGSSAAFYKDHEYPITISSAPLRMSVEVVDEVNANQEMTFTAEITSNSASVVKKLLFKADYESGFTFEGASPLPAYDKDTWFIGDLRPGEKRTIRIRGKVSGNEDEKKAFNFSIGIQDPLNDKLISTPFLTVSKSVVIKKPFISTSISFDGSPVKIYSVNSGQRVNAEIFWSNNLPTKISDLEIEAKIEGQALDRASVKVSNGFFRSLDNTVVWNKNELGDFTLVDSGENGSVNFSLSSLPLSSLLSTSLTNQEIFVTVTMRAKRLASTVEGQEVYATAKKSFRIMSNVDLSGRVVYSAGPFKNFGPIPPKAERETSYTVFLNITDTLNNLNDVVVSATLPTYVEWLGQYSSGEKVTYNEDTRTILWEIDSVKSRTGFNSSPKELAFQVSILPSISQVGTSPVLVKDISLSSNDSFAGKVLKDAISALTTTLSNDPVYSREEGNVVP